MRYRPEARPVWCTGKEKVKPSVAAAPPPRLSGAISPTCPDAQQRARANTWIRAGWAERGGPPSPPTPDTRRCGTRKAYGFGQSDGKKRAFSAMKSKSASPGPAMSASDTRCLDCCTVYSPLPCRVTCAGSADVRASLLERVRIRLVANQLQQATFSTRKLVPPKSSAR